MASNDPDRRSIDMADATPDELLSTEVEQHGDAVLVRLAGELDLLTAPLLTERVEALILEAPRILALDLQAVQFLGSSGLAALVGCRDAAIRTGVELRLICTTQVVLRPLAATALTDVFDIHGDPDSALQTAPT